MSLPLFVQKTYLADVLTPALETGHVPDEFARYGLDRTVDATDEEIRGRLKAVNAFWEDFESRIGGSGGFVLMKLRADHKLLEPLLGSGRSRLKLREELETADAIRIAGAREIVNRQIQQLLGEMGGTLTMDVRLRIDVQAVADQNGISPEAVGRLLDEHPWEEGTDAPQPQGATLPRSVIADIARELAFVERSTGDEVSGRSLYALLAVPPGTRDVERMRRALGVLRNRRDGTRDKGLQLAIGNLIARVDEYLIEADGAGAAYRETLAMLAGQELRRRLKADHFAVLAGGARPVISPERIEQFRQEMVETGVEPGRTAAVVRDAVIGAGCGLPNSAASAAPELVVCPVCGHAHGGGRPAGCAKCGAVMFGPCPNGRCTGHVAPDLDRCNLCGLDLQHVRRLPRGVATVREALQRREMGRAATAAAAFELKASDGPEVADVLHQLASAKEEGRGLVEAGERAAGENRWVAARDAFEGALKLDPSLETRLGPIGDAVATAQRRVDEVSHAFRQHSSAGEISDSRVMQLAAQCVDHPEVVARLKARAPEPPASLSIAQQGSLVRLQWEASPSPGVKGYEVVRESSSVGGTNPSREILGQLDVRELIDENAPAGASILYEVSSLRAGRRSETSRRSKPFRHLPDPVDAVALGRPGKVVIRWRDTPSLAPRRTHVIRDRVPGERDMRRFESDGTSVVDEDVIAGTTYAYLVTYVYTLPGGRKEQTDGVELSVRVPEQMEALEMIEVAYQPDGSLRLHAEYAGSGRVAFLRPKEGFPFAQGEEVPVSDLERRADYLVRGALDALLPSPTSGEILEIVAVTVFGDVSMIGPRTRILGAEALPRIGLRAFGPLVRLEIPWSKLNGTSRVAVGWRFDRRPASVEDVPQEQRTVVSKNQPFPGIRTQGKVVCYVVAAPVATVGAVESYGPHIWESISMGSV